MKKNHTFRYTQIPIKELTPDWLILLDHAKSVANKAYAPYSQFRVGAAGITKNGTIVVGCNQENASFPVGICAERNLLSTLEANEKEPLSKLVIYSPDAKTILSPCGMCRQALIEYQERFEQKIECLLLGKNSAIIIHNVKDLLPFGFDKNAL